MNAIIVYNSEDFFASLRKLSKDTWLVWIDKSFTNEVNQKGEPTK